MTQKSNAEAAISSAPPSVEGWQWVPKEPTREMLLAGWAAPIEHGARWDNKLEAAHLFTAPVYRAMLSAAPVPPQKGDSMDNDPPLLGGLATGDQRPGDAVLPCPFCGSSASLVGEIDGGPADYWDLFVGCDNCDAQGPTILRERGDDQDAACAEAREEWNRRAAISAPGTPVVSNTPDEAAVVPESSPLDVRADMLAALEEIAGLKMSADKTALLYLLQTAINVARAAIARAKGGQP